MAARERGVAGVDNTSRRTWDKEAIAKQISQRLSKDSKSDEDAPEEIGDDGIVLPRMPLKAREYQLNLKSKLGKSQVVTATTPLNQQAGYYCDVCECVVKDSANFLDHINGKKHQRALGMSMRPERSTLDQVRKRFEQKRKRPYASTALQDDDEPVVQPPSLEERVKQQEEEERKRKAAYKEQKKERKSGRGRSDDDVADESAVEMASMGLPMGFGTSSKK